MDLKCLLIHTSTGCTLDIHPAGTFTTTFTTLLLLRRPLNELLTHSLPSRTYENLFPLFFRTVFQPYFFISHDHQTFTHWRLFVDGNTEVITNSKILMEQSVLPRKMIKGGKKSQHVDIVRTIVTCFFLQPDNLTVIGLKPFFAKDLPYWKKFLFHPCYWWVVEDIFQS